MHAIKNEMGELNYSSDFVLANAWNEGVIL